MRALAREVALERPDDGALLLRREVFGQLEPRSPSVIGLPHSGMFPCLRAGTASRLVASIRSALINRGRVSAGSITSST